ARAPTAARANALWEVGYLALLQNDLLAARSFFEDGLSAARELGFAFGAAMSLALLGAEAAVQGDLERAASRLDESAALLPDVPDDTDRYVATILSMYWRMELARNRGDHALAIALLEEGLALVRDRGDTWSSAFGLDVGGRLAWLQGDLPRAIRLQRESLLLRREMDDRLRIASC